MKLPIAGNSGQLNLGNMDLLTSKSTNRRQGFVPATLPLPCQNLMLLRANECERSRSAKLYGGLMRKIPGHGWLALVLVLVPGAGLCASKPGDGRPYGQWTPRRGAGHSNKRPALCCRRRTCAIDEWFSWVSGQPDHIDITWGDGRVRVLFLPLASLRTRHFPEIF